MSIHSRSIVQYALSMSCFFFDLYHPWFCWNSMQLGGLSDICVSPPHPLHPLCLPSVSWTLHTRLYRPGRVLPQPVPGQLHWAQQRYGVLRLPPLPPRGPLHAGLSPGHLQVWGLALHHHGPVLSSAPTWRHSVCHPRGRMHAWMPLRLHTQWDESVRTCPSLQSPHDVFKSNTTSHAVLERFHQPLT